MQARSLPAGFWSPPAWLVAALAACLLAGCSAEAWRREADRWAYAIIRTKQKEVTGKAAPFTVERPSDTLRKRLLLGQKLPISHPASLGSDRLARIPHWPEKFPRSKSDGRPRPTPLPTPLPTPTTQPAQPPWQGAEPLKVTLTGALQIAARNSREYQQRKEDVFAAALNLDLERQAFRNTFYGSLNGLGQIDRSSGTVGGFEGGGSLEWNRQLRTGASLAMLMGVDLAKLLTMDRRGAYGVFGDATVTIPLLRGSGEYVVTEAMTQAERDVVYAMWTLERFKRTLAVQTASEYLGVLQQWDQVINAGENYKRLIASGRRARRLADAGRLPQIQVDQARQDELRARDRWITARQRYEHQVDAFKITLGLPTDAKLEPDHQALKVMAKSAGADLAKTRAKSTATTQPVPADAPIELRPPSKKGGAMEMPADKAIRLALANRCDLKTAHGEVYDAQRAVAVAADALRAGLTLTAAASAGGRRGLGSAASGNADLRPSRGVYTAQTVLDLPLERTAERNAYRESFLALEAAVRGVQELEDRVKLQIRDALRDLLSARESYAIQDEAVALAQRRVTSTGLFLEAGRAQIRDVLEAQEALVSAQNARTAALVSYRIAELNLQRDMGVLAIDEKGLWHEYHDDRTD